MRMPLPFPISLRCALVGILHAWRTQRNLRIQGFFALAAGLGACFLALPPTEVALVVLACAWVLGAELMNTAVEAAVDLHGPRHHPLAKIAKDVAAGSVVASSLGAAGAGVLLFGSKLFPLAFRAGGWRWALGLVCCLGLARLLLEAAQRSEAAADQGSEAPPTSQAG